MKNMGVADKTVSVVVATYNGARFIEQLLISVIQQTLAPSEIIIADDGSTDGTLDIVKKISSKCEIDIIIISNKKRLGFRDNFLNASLSADGDFIAFCDQDDVWDVTKLEKASKYFYDKRISMIVHSAISFSHVTGKTKLFSQGIKRTGIKAPLSYDPWQTFFGFSIIFRREILYIANINDRFKDFIVPNENIAHDRWIMFLGQVVGQTVELNEPLVRYRQHSENQFGDGSRKKIKSTLKNDIELFNDYIDATIGMKNVLSGLPDNTNLDFPLFNRDKATLFFSMALRQLEARKSIYEASNRYRALMRLCKNVRSGVYKSVHSGSIRWRSALKDLKHTIVK